MMRISHKEDIAIYDRGFIWKYLFLTILYTNDLEEAVMKEIVTASSVIVQKCIQEMEKKPSDEQVSKIARVFYFCMATLAAVCGTSSAIWTEFSSYCAKACMFPL